MQGSFSQTPLSWLQKYGGAQECRRQAISDRLRPDERGAVSSLLDVAAASVEHGLRRGGLLSVDPQRYVPPLRLYIFSSIVFFLLAALLSTDSISIASTTLQEGKTMVAINLAITMAQCGMKVLLVSC